MNWAELLKARIFEHFTEEINSNARVQELEKKHGIV